MKITSELAPDGWSLITTCEGLVVCDQEQLPRDEALAPCFTGVGSGNLAFHLKDEFLMQAVENALFKLTNHLERGNCPTITADRSGNLCVKVVLIDELESTRQLAVQKIHQILESLFEASKLRHRVQAAELSPMPIPIPFQSRQRL